MIMHDHQAQNLALKLIKRAVTRRHHRTWLGKIKETLKEYLSPFF
jgi:hypothetical protein